jgi:hypothetical protein
MPEQDQLHFPFFLIVTSNVVFNTDDDVALIVLPKVFALNRPKASGERPDRTDAPPDKEPTHPLWGYDPPTVVLGLGRGGPTRAVTNFCPLTPVDRS